MKPNHFFSLIHLKLTLIASLFGLHSLQAQTFRGHKQLTELPKRFEALIYPVETRPQTIRINLDNPGRTRVHVVIRSEKGEIVFDEYKSDPASREYYNLSSLPTGNYVVELSAYQERLIRAFTIKPHQRSQITMDDGTRQITPEFLTNRRLVVND